MISSGVIFLLCCVVIVGFVGVRAWALLAALTVVCRSRLGGGQILVGGAPEWFKGTSMGGGLRLRNGCAEGAARGRSAEDTKFDGPRGESGCS